MPRWYKVTTRDEDVPVILLRGDDLEEALDVGGVDRDQVIGHEVLTLDVWAVARTIQQDIRRRGESSDATPDQKLIMETLWELIGDEVINT